MSDEKPVTHTTLEWSLPNDEGDRQLAAWFDEHDTGFEPGDEVTVLLTREYNDLATENAQLRQQLEEARGRADVATSDKNAARAEARDLRARLQTVESQLSNTKERATDLEHDLAHAQAQLQTAEGERDEARELAQRISDAATPLIAAQRENGVLREALERIASGSVSSPGSCGVMWTSRVPREVTIFARAALRGVCSTCGNAEDINCSNGLHAPPSPWQRECKGCVVSPALVRYADDCPVHGKNRPGQCAPASPVAPARGGVLDAVQSSPWPDPPAAPVQGSSEDDWCACGKLGWPHVPGDHLFPPTPPTSARCEFRDRFNRQCIFDGGHAGSHGV